MNQEPERPSSLHGVLQRVKLLAVYIAILVLLVACSKTNDGLTITGESAIPATESAVDPPDAGSSELEVTPVAPLAQFLTDNFTGRPDCYAFCVDGVHLGRSPYEARKLLRPHRWEPGSFIAKLTTEDGIIQEIRVEPHDPVAIGAAIELLGPPEWVYIGASLDHHQKGGFLGTFMLLYPERGIIIYDIFLNREEGLSPNTVAHVVTFVAPDYAYPALVFQNAFQWRGYGGPGVYYDDRLQPLLTQP